MAVEREPNRAGLDPVVELGGGAVEVHVVDAVAGNAGLLQRERDRARGLLAGRLGAHPVVGVARRAVAQHLGERRRAPPVRAG